MGVERRDFLVVKGSKFSPDTFDMTLPAPEHAIPFSLPQVPARQNTTYQVRTNMKLMSINGHSADSEKVG